MQIPDVAGVLELRFVDLDGDGDDELVLLDGSNPHVLDDVEQPGAVVTTELNPGPGPDASIRGRVGVRSHEGSGQSLQLALDSSLVSFKTDPSFGFQPGDSFEVDGGPIEGLFADVIDGESRLLAWSAAENWFFCAPPTVRSVEGPLGPVETAVIDGDGVIAGIASRVHLISAPLETEPIEQTTLVLVDGPVQVVAPDGDEGLVVGYEFGDRTGPAWTNFDFVDLISGTSGLSFSIPVPLGLATVPGGGGELRLVAAAADELFYVRGSEGEAWRESCLVRMALGSTVVAINAGDHDGDGSVELACVLDDGSAWFIDP